MQIALIYADPKKKRAAALTRFFTGSNCYHVAFVSDDGKYMWDMHRLMRRVIFGGRYDPRWVRLVPAPFEASPATLDKWVLYGLEQFCAAKSIRDFMGSLYGWRDYIGFALRPLYHCLGWSTRNYGGRICSGLLRDLAVIIAGWTSPELGDVSAAEPSPGDWCRALGQPLVWVPELV
jgi:hypothetical protein